MKSHISNKITGFLRSEQLILIVFRIMGVSLLFSGTLILTNYYEQKTVGDFELARSILLLLGAIVVLGVDRSILQIAGQLESEGKIERIYSIYKKMIKLIFISSLLLLLLYLVIPKNIIDQVINYKLGLKVIFSLFFYAVVILNTEVFRVFEEHKWSEAYRGIFKYIIFVSGAVVLLFLELKEWIIDVFLFMFIPLSFFTSYQLYGYFNKERSEYDLSYREIIKKSAPMAMAGLGFFLLLSIDVIMIKYFLKSQAVAIYAQPVKIIAIIAMIQTTLQAFISKDIAVKFYSQDREGLKIILKNNTRLIAVLSLPIIVLLGMFATSILSIFGTEYEQGSTVLLILLAGSLINAICGCTSSYMNMTGKQNVFRNIIFITVVFNLIANIFLIPNYGITGAAIASAISMVLWNVLVVLYAYYKNQHILILH